MKYYYEVKVAQSCLTLCDPMGCSLWNSSGQNTGVGSLFLLQGVFPIQGLNLGLPHCSQILYQLSHKGNPGILEWVAYPFSSGSSPPRNQTRVSCIAGRFFTKHYEALLQTKILEAIKVLHSLCHQIWKTQQWPQDWKSSLSVQIPKKGNTKECSNYGTIVLISHAYQIMLIILQARLQYMN